MALTPETGAGLANADSFASEAEALAHHASFANAAWSAAGVTAPQQEAALRRAARLLDASYHWRGSVATETQALSWPRECVTDRHGREIATDVVPAAVKAAQCELALLILAGGGGELVGGSAGNSATAAGAIKRVKADTVEVEYAQGQRAAAPVSASNILPDGAGELLDRILAGLFVPPNPYQTRLAKA